MDSKQKKKFCAFKFVADHLKGQKSNVTSMLYDEEFDESITNEFEDCVEMCVIKRKENKDVLDNLEEEILDLSKYAIESITPSSDILNCQDFENEAFGECCKVVSFQKKN